MERKGTAIPQIAKKCLGFFQKIFWRQA